MNHDDHVALLRGGVQEHGDASPVWADFGAGDGAFTLALADLLGAGAHIIAIDRDQRAVDRLQRTVTAQFPDTTLDVLRADFTQPLALPPLDGIVMANALHFVTDRAKDDVIGKLRDYLRPGGRLLMVEYNTDRGNSWVPHPFAYPTWETLARRNGFVGTRLLATRPSRLLGEIYAAVSLAPDGDG